MPFLRSLACCTRVAPAVDFAEEGVTPDNFPKTWDELPAGSRQENEGQEPAAQSDLGAYAFGDAPAGAEYPYLWSWGVKEVEADAAKTVAPATARETIEYGQVRGRHVEGCAYDEGRDVMG